MEQVKGSSFDEEVKSVNPDKKFSRKERLDSSRISKSGVKSTPRLNHLIKPLWESNKIIDHPIKSGKAGNSRQEKQFKSEPRQYRNPSIHPKP